MCSWNPCGTVCAFLMGPFILLINWILVKSVFIKSLWDRVWISYGTVPISHKLNFGQMWVQKFLIEPWVYIYFLWDPSYYLINWSLVKSVFMKSLWDRVCISYGTLPITHKLNFGQICVHEILMGPWGYIYLLWDPSYYS